MYGNNSSSYSNRSSFKPRRYSGGFRGSRGSSGGGFGGSSRSGFRGSSRGRFSRRSELGMDISRFINKSATLAPAKEYVSQNMFSDFAITDLLKKNIMLKGFTAPTPIQDQAIPHILDGKDLIGIANTGTGKTAAFLLPLLEKVLKDRTEKVLIMVPTRELAQQIETELNSLAKGTNIWSVVCIGGASMGKQISFLRKPYNFIIGTPGRLKDLSSKNFFKLSSFNTVVLDEVDRMFDMGFVDEIKKLLAQLPTKRQSLFFSATLSPAINTLIQTFMVNPVSVSIKSRETSVNVDQDVVRVPNSSDKIDVLFNLLTQEQFKKVLIFENTKMGVQRLFESLFQRGLKVESIHGDKSQYQRQHALHKFKIDKINILVATDVAARGLDISDVTHVINFGLPMTYDDYIHRIGRTGRGNKKGQALTFVS